MKIAVIGEGMLELSRDPAAEDRWRLHYGGDTLNTAIHLARLGFDVSFITALGDDPFSDKLRTAWRAEGLNVDHVLVYPGRLPGLYAIETATDGERSFSYWRGDSAARGLFDLAGIEEAMGAATEADLLYFSLISLAVLPEDARQKLYRLAERIRQSGGIVAFDSNFRPRTWSNIDHAREAAAKAATLSHIGLPTLGDEQLLNGLGDAEAVIDHWLELGTGEVVVKLGANGCLISRPGSHYQHVPALSDLEIVDTSGAGDAFNAGYLGARMHQETPEVAVARGHRLAAWVVQRQGAIPPIDSGAAYEIGEGWTWQNEH